MITKKEQRRIYYLNNKDKILKQNLQYYQEHKEQYQKQKRQRYQDNRESIKKDRREYRLANRDKCREYEWKNRDRIKNNRLKREYGITLEQYNKMLSLQNGHCAICQHKRKLKIDHNHRTGKVRELICDNCNMSLGQLNENIIVLQNMITYINKHTSKNS